MAMLSRLPEGVAKNNRAREYVMPEPAGGTWAVTRSESLTSRSKVRVSEV
jgi:hypothetical protein